MLRSAQEYVHRSYLTGIVENKDKPDSWFSKLCQAGEYLHVQLPLLSLLKLFSIYHCPGTDQAPVMLTASQPQKEVLLYRFYMIQV